MCVCVWTGDWGAAGAEPGVKQVCGWLCGQRWRSLMVWKRPVLSLTREKSSGMAAASLSRGCGACEDLQVASKLLDGAGAGRGKLLPLDAAGFPASARAQALAGITTLFPLLSRPAKGCRHGAS